MLFSFLGNAQASLATWTDVWDPADVLLNDTNHHYDYTHDITDDGFDVGQDFVSSYHLTIGLYDDSHRDKPEWAWINLPGWITDGPVEIDYEDIERGWSLMGLIALNTTGLLHVDIYRLCGDFYFAESTLNAHGCEANPVPIPSSVFLFASGLVGYFGVRRKFGWRG